jgi:hypothetical protein
MFFRGDKSMTKLDDLYRQFLQFGFVVLRQALDAHDSEWMTAEVELLHNVPSLIGEKNPSRHRYFWDQERTAYLDWVRAPGRELQKSRMATYYEPLWKEMENCVTNLGTQSNGKAGE